MIHEKPYRLAGVVGWPVAHSRSPLLHNHWLKKHHLPGAYVYLPVAPSKLEQALRGLPALGFAGCNVTIPHKIEAMRLAEQTSGKESLSYARALSARAGVARAARLQSESVALSKASYALFARLLPAGDVQVARAKVALADALSLDWKFEDAKALLREASERDLKAQLAEEEKSFIALAATADFNEGLDAFFERRAPLFGGD